VRKLRTVRLAGAAAALALLLASCAQNAPQDSLRPAGPYQEEIHRLFVPVFWVAAAIFFLVQGALVYLLLRYRHRRGREGIPPQVHGNTRLEIAWTIAPALILVFVAVPTVSTIWDLARRPSGDVLHVEVVGHQWWWEFRYTDPAYDTGEGPLTTANQLHVPVGRTVELTLTADPQDVLGAGNAVIHSFWAGRLFGKQDVVPGRENRIVFSADEPGVYPGQCYEFCGLSHAWMRFEIVAQTPEEFEAWVRAQLPPATAPAGGLAARGLDVFTGPLSSGLGTCIACHTIRGVETAAGKGGPDLTHLASRDCFAGCKFRLTEENLRAWLRDPPAMKEGSFMPNYRLTDEEIDALVAFLLTLR
jgi:cytochrome c oxidase subunit 2